MSTSTAGTLPAPGRSRVATITAGVLFLTTAALGLTWAKWDPYMHKLTNVWGSHSWPGTSILDSAGTSAAAPTWRGAWSFTLAYGKAVWMALVAALVISAALEALVPRERVVKLLTRPTPVGASAAGGLLALPCLMCTCCTAPVASTLRRSGAPTGSVLGYWLGNPVLNPATLAFLALVAPWQWVATRAIVGAALVFGVSALIGTRAGEPSRDPMVAHVAAEPFRVAAAPRRFVRALARLTFTLVPEYFVVVLALGAFRGWLFPLGANATHWGLLAVLVAAVAGTLVVIPTAGEIPILQGLAAAGVGAGPLGALLITLPAISLPSMVMVGRALTWRVTVITAAAVALTGVASGALFWALT